jgi:hypothetical protein
MMTSTTNFILLESDLKYHVKGEYEFRNTRSGIRIITKEMAAYLAMKSSVEKINRHQFTFSPNSEKPIKVVIRHLPPETLAKDTYSQQPRELRLHRHQSEANYSHLNSNQWTNPRGTLPPIPCYLKKKHEICRDIQAE